MTKQVCPTVWFGRLLSWIAQN